MRSRLIKYLSWIGPYPYNPWLIFIFFTSIYFSRFLPGINQQPEGSARWIGGLTILALATLPSGVFAFLSFVVQKYRFWPSNLFSYVLEVAVGQGFLLLFSPIIAQVLKDRLSLAYSAPVTLTPSLFLFSLALVLGMLAVMHRTERIILNRLKSADALAAKLEVDRQGLVRADEELRHQTSRFLHDRVQSDLMVAGMKLKSVAGTASPEVNEVIDRVISKLEKTRTADLRDLVQVLAPNFEAADFRESVKVLVRPYLSAMEVVILVDDTSENLDEETLLGAFRIIEQSLINSLVHGPAKNVKVSIETDDQAMTRLQISDDGPGCSMDQTDSGVGTAVIDSWIGILGGTKTIDTVLGQGYRLTVEFSAPRQKAS